MCVCVGACVGGGEGEGEVGGGSMCSTCTEGVSLHVSVSVCGWMGGIVCMAHIIIHIQCECMSCIHACTCTMYTPGIKFCATC